MDYIYLDHASTTPMNPEVVEAMLPYLTQHYGNPSSIHALGRAAKLALSRCRDELAAWLDCAPQELILTGSGSESINLAMIGAVTALAPKGHIITTAIEHQAVLQACEHLEAKGYEVTRVAVDKHGMVDPVQIEKAIRPDTLLVSVMAANNEVGTIQLIHDIGQLVQSRQICFHSDGVQALGSIRLKLSQLPVDLMSFSAHKINGPKGVGILYAKNKVRLTPLIFGGMQERKRRAGTENVAGMVGLAKAMEIISQNMPDRIAHLQALKDCFISHISESLEPSSWKINGHQHEVLPHILNISFLGISSETMLMNLDLEGIGASSGSACTAGSLEPSHVLQAMKVGDERLKSAIRFSFGQGLTTETVMHAAKKVVNIVNRLRS